MRAKGIFRYIVIREERRGVTCRMGLHSVACHL